LVWANPGDIKIIDETAAARIILFVTCPLRKIYAQ